MNHGSNDAMTKRHVRMSQQCMTVRVTHTDNKFLHLVPRLIGGGGADRGKNVMRMLFFCSMYNNSNAHAAPPYIC